MGKGIFFTSASLLLAVVITTTLHSRHHHHHQDPSVDLASDASRSLRSNGFNFIATLLHISPELFLSPPQSTIFAIPDSAMSNLSIPPYMTKHLLTYHISPLKLTIEDLFKKPINTCLPTLFQEQEIAITRIDKANRVLEINNVSITHPDLFLQGPVSIHGVAGSFASFDHQEINQLPVCESKHNEVPLSSVSVKLDFIENRAKWGKVVKFLSSSGFIPFAIGLNSVIDGILQDYPDLNSVTIFAPPNMALTAMPSSLLDKYVRFHIVQQRLSFQELASLPEGAFLRTLVPDKKALITETVYLSPILSINEVEITAPDLFSSTNFVVHGIARPFRLPGSSM